MKIIIRLLALTFSLIFSFIITQAFLQWLEYEMTLACGLTAHYGYNDVGVPQNIHVWTHGAVLAVDFIPPIVCLFIGLYIFQRLIYQEVSWGPLQFLAYWLCLCFINIFCSNMLFAPMGVADPQSVFYQTFARVACWFNMPAVMALALSILAAIGDVLIGFLLCRETLKLSHSYTLVDSNVGKNVVIFIYFIIPVILCAPLVMLLGKGASFIRFAIIMLNFFLIGFGMFLRNSMGPYEIEFEKTESGPIFTAFLGAMSIVTWGSVFLFFR